MRFLVSFFLLAVSALAAVPAELATALENFRADPPRGWSYTQTTVAEGKSTVERYDATKIEWERWSLVKKDDRTPTADELKEYSDIRSRRSRGGTAPKLTDQLDLESLEVVETTPERVTYRFRVRPGEAGDKVAAHLRAKLVLHKATQTVESLELTSVEAFSPTLAVNIAEMTTAMTYHVPEGDTPTRPRQVLTRVRGRAFWLKSLDAEMTVTYSDYQKAVRPSPQK